MLVRSLLRAPLVQASLPITIALLLAGRIVVPMLSGQDPQADRTLEVMFCSWAALLILAANGVQGIVSSARSVLGMK